MTTPAERLTDTLYVEVLVCKCECGHEWGSVPVRWSFDPREAIRCGKCGKQAHTAKYEVKDILKKDDGHD